MPFSWLLPAAELPPRFHPSSSPRQLAFLSLSSASSSLSLLLCSSTCLVQVAFAEKKKLNVTFAPPTSQPVNICIVCTSSALLVVQQNKKTMSYAWVHSDVLINHFLCVYRSDPDEPPFLPPRMDLPGHWTQWSHRQHDEIVRMDADRDRARILVENERKKMFSSFAHPP